ncbi:MAG: fused MFS/spermidine synthase [Planctomycetota bacterium]
MSKRASVNWIMLIYFASGACSLIDEVVWVRLLKLTLGNTVYATSIVVSVFMGGLALGALVMSRYSDRVVRRLRLYALLETLVTISALSLPWMLKLTDRIYVWFYRAYQPRHWELLLVQVLISAAVLLVPSMLMGSTLPLLGRFVTALEKQAGHLVGRLYALNTLGAAAGCFLAGFVLIRGLGVMGALYVAAALNLLVAFGGWLLSRSPGVVEEQENQNASGELSGSLRAKELDSRFYLLVAAFFMSGLISISYELLWMRSIVHLLGGYTYVFSAVLTVYLLGNVLGAAIGSRLAKRLKVPATGFAVSLGLLGLCGIFYLPVLIFWMSKGISCVETALGLVYSRVPASAFTVGPLVHSTFLFLFPSIIMGVGFPLALQAWAKHLHKVGRSTGTAYGANTIGAVAGGIVTGFVLIPLLGLQVSISVLGLTGLWMAGLMLFVFGPISRVIRRSSLLASAALVTMLVVISPANLFDTVVRISPTIPDWELVRVEEGTTTTVSLHRDSVDGSLQLHSSGQSIAGDSYAERGDQKMLGHFGVLLNRRAKRVLSVGFGSGETTFCLAQHQLENVDCVEIAPEVVDVSLEHFTHINLGERLDEEVNMIFMDAKNHLHLTDRKYDVIVNDSIHPREFAENASLYSKEYFESAKKRLNDDGIIMSWLPTYGMPASVFSSIIGTLMEVFGHVTIWYPAIRPAPLVLIAGSEKQQYFSPRHVQNELVKEGVATSLSGIEVRSSVDVLSCYVGDERDLLKAIKDFSVNSDYDPFVEFNTDQSSPQSEIFSRFVVNVRSESIHDHIDWTGWGRQEKDEWLKAYGLMREASSWLFKAKAASVNLDKLRYCIQGLSILPDSSALLDGRAQANRLLYTDSVRLIEWGNSKEALDLAGRMLRIDPESATAWMITVNARLSQGDMEAALSAAKRAVEAAPDDPETHFNLGFILYQMGRFETAIAAYDQMLSVAEAAGGLSNYRRAQMLDALAAVYAAAGRFDEAVAIAEKALWAAVRSERKDLIDHVRTQLSSIQAAQSARQGR